MSRTQRLWHRRYRLCLLSLCLAAGSAAADIRRVAVATKDLVFDPVSGRLYASAPAHPSPGGSVSGDGIAVIEPVTGSIERFMPVGSQPGQLALSDDGRYLYVALDGTAAVQRVDLRSGRADLQFPIEAPPFEPGHDGPLFVEDMQVVPGNPQAVALSRQRRGVSPRFAGVVVYDNGVRRPNISRTHTGSNLLAFSESPALLYGLDTEVTNGFLQRMAIDATGVTVLDSAPVFGINRDFKFAEGLLYGGAGRVLDPDTYLLVGTYHGLDFSDLVAPDPAGGRVFFLKTLAARHGGVPQLLVFDQERFLPRGKLRVPVRFERASSLLRWGPDGLAFRTETEVVLIRSPLVSGAPAADLVLHATTARGPVRAGEPLAYGFTVTNEGPDPATSVTLTNALPSGLAFVSASATQGTCRASRGTVVCSLGEIAVGGSATVNLIVTPTAAGRVVNTATVSAKEADPEPSDNSAMVTVDLLPPCARDVSAAIRVLPQALRYDTSTLRFQRDIQLQNRSRQPIAGPVSLVLDGLSARALANAAGQTRCVSPLGTPYLAVPVGTDGVLRPRETATVTLIFALPSASRLPLRTRVLAGEGDR